MGEEQNFGAISVAKMNRSLLESASQRSLCFGHNLKINRAPPPPPLPEEIITEEILTRIPLESLLRFRLVCKRWNSLLSDPVFARSHLNINGISGNPNNNDYLIIQSRFPNFLSIISRNNLSENKLSYPSMGISTKIFLIGSINGLVCVACSYQLNYHFILWNPAIRLSKIILLPTHWQQLQCCFPYGFGWDSVANDFKLLAIPLRGDDDIVAGVYSCKTDCWTYHKLAPQVTLHLQNCQYWPNVIVKGIPYWKIGFGMVLLKFEFTSKEFKLLTVLSRVRPNYRLVNLNDCLGRIDYLRDGRKGMEVYRYDEECDLWCKMHTINVGISDLIISFPISFKFGGEILFDQNHNLYDPKSNQIKSSDHHGKYVTHGFSYSPSMIVLEGMKPLQT